VHNAVEDGIVERGAYTERFRPPIPIMLSAPDDGHWKCPPVSTRRLNPLLPPSLGAEGSLSPRPQARIRAGATRKSAPHKRIPRGFEYLAAKPAPAVESRLSPAGVLLPGTLCARIVRMPGGGYLASAKIPAAGVAIMASAPTFAGVLAELASAVSGALEAAHG
jgi:hypothetical protein